MSGDDKVCSGAYEKRHAHDGLGMQGREKVYELG